MNWEFITFRVAGGKCVDLSFRGANSEEYIEEMKDKDLVEALDWLGKVGWDFACEPFREYGSDVFTFIFKRER